MRKAILSLWVASIDAKVDAGKKQRWWEGNGSGKDLRLVETE